MKVFLAGLWIVAYVIGIAAVVLGLGALLFASTFDGDVPRALGLFFLSLVWFLGLWLIGRRLFADRWPNPWWRR